MSTLENWDMDADQRPVVEKLMLTMSSVERIDIVKACGAVAANAIYDHAGNHFDAAEGLSAFMTGMIQTINNRTRALKKETRQ